MNESTPSARDASPATLLPSLKQLVDRIGKLDRTYIVAISVTVILVSGLLDYYTGGMRLAFAVVYTLPIALGTWFAGRRVGVALIVLSTITWLAGDLYAGVVWSGPWVPIWNCLVRSAYYLFIVVLLTNLHELQNTLEKRVRIRTEALTRAFEERRRLESELLDASDREQRRIGADIHDGLSQHLTGTALAGAVLAEKLKARGLPEAADANRIVRLLEESLSLSRKLAKGLNPVELGGDGLMYALREFAAGTTDLFRIPCLFECDYPVFLENPTAAVQLFRIAQEAVGNAVKHAHASRIVVSLTSDQDSVILRVSDDGIGIANSSGRDDGAGLRIMSHRASLIGAALAVAPAPRGGTVVTCILPAEVETRANG